MHNFDPAVVASGVFMHVLLQEVCRLGVQAEDYYAGKLNRVHALLGAARRVCKASAEYDVVHAQYGSACAFVCRNARCAKLLTLRGSDLYGTEVGSWRARAHGRLARTMTQVASRSFPTTIVMSQRMAGELRQLGYRGNTVVLPDGIDLERFRPIDRMEARARLGHEGDRGPWIGFASYRGLSNAIKRAGLAEATMECVRCQLRSAKLKVLMGIEPEQMPLWVNALDVVLLTSTHEGWPNIIKEGLACNVPFVSTDVSDLSLIAELEPSCTVASPDPEDLARGILKALAAGRPPTLRRHVEGMSAGLIARKLVDLYRAVISEQR